MGKRKSRGWLLIRYIVRGIEPETSVDEPRKLSEISRQSDKADSTGASGLSGSKSKNQTSDKLLASSTSSKRQPEPEPSISFDFDELSVYAIKTRKLHIIISFGIALLILMTATTGFLLFMIVSLKNRMDISVELQQRSDQQLRSTLQLFESVKKKQNTNILFSASLSNSKSYREGEVLVFDLINSNLGGGYSNESGQFKCPVAGYYAFHVHVLGQPDKSADFRLFHNDWFANGVYVEKGFKQQTGSVTMIIHLEKDDIMKVEAKYYSAAAGGKGHVNFSGELLVMD